MLTLIVVDFNYTNTEWHYSSNGGTSAWCGRLSANDTKFINAIRERICYINILLSPPDSKVQTHHILWTWC